MKGQIWQDDQRPSGTETEMLTRFEVGALGQYLQIQYPEFLGSAASLLNERVAF